MFRQPVSVPDHFSQRTAALVTAVTLVLGPIQEAPAQSSIPNAMQGFSQNRDQPVQIEADALEVREKTKQATFSGNVKVVQGDTTMTSKSLEVLYASDAPISPNATSPQGAQPLHSAQPGPGGNSAIKRLEARGNVVVTQKDQVVTGQRAVFDSKTNLITMLGGVVLTRCGNMLSGDRLLVDMTTGVSRVEADSGKVKASVNQSSEAGCATPSALPVPATPPKR
jgi:lipopolysaccharide export system protein LptA